MKITFQIENVQQFQYLKKFAFSRGKQVDVVIDTLIKKACSKIKNVVQSSFSQKDNRYTINDYLDQKLKFKYLIYKDGSIKCIQFSTIKDLNYSYDGDLKEAYIYLLLAGCPNKVDVGTLQKYSLRLSVEDLYDKIYGEGNYKKYAEKNVLDKIQKSQIIWKNRRKRGN